MKSFSLRLQDATHSEEMAGVTSFVGEDASGSFGILAGHARMMSLLIIGLARFRIGEGAWQYLALPGAVLYFHNNMLTLSTRHYLLDDDYMRISQALQQQLLAEEEKLHTMKESLHHMEEEVLKRLWEMGRKGIG
ncbi:MAG: F0F1 ATP synthase subunit epsilon [Gammaproteobacteria bacterium]|nr:MAG: F0F1 ATP synthase subunit epsilon [Gammaproteobacteria bacterium]